MTKIAGGMKPVGIVLTLVALAILTLVYPLWCLLLSPITAIGSAVHFYERRRVPAVVFILTLIICAGIAGLVGVFLGARWTCSGPHPGNQCFLPAVFVIGPITAALAVISVGRALSLRPRRGTAGYGLRS